MVLINQFVQLQKIMGDQLDVLLQLVIYYYEFNIIWLLFNDVCVCCVLNMVFDKDIIVGKVFGQGQCLVWLIGQLDIGGVMLYNLDYVSWLCEKWIVEVKKLLVQVGYDESYLLVFILFYNIFELYQCIVIVVSFMWKKNFGVEVKLQNQEWKMMLDIMYMYNFDVVCYVWIVDYDDVVIFFNIFCIGDSENISQYSNFVYDEVLCNVVKVFDVVIWGKYYQQVEDLLVQDVFVILVYYYVCIYLVKFWVGGFMLDKLGYYYIKDMYIKKYLFVSGDGC